MDTDQPSPEIGPWSWHLEWLWTLSLTNEKRKHQNIVLQQQIRNLHKEKAGWGEGGFEHRSQAAWFSSRSFRVWKHLFSTPFETPFQSDFETGRSHPPSWAVGLCKPPHPTQAQGDSSRFPAARSQAGKDNECSEHRGEGGAGPAGTHGPPPLTGSWFLCILFRWR